MTDIKSKEYITVKCNDKGLVGVFVGWRRVKKYHGEEIHRIEYVKDVFKWIKQQNPNIDEFHIISSVTPGTDLEKGNPSARPGPYAWCRVKYNNGNVGSWVFNRRHITTASCAHFCAYSCVYDVRESRGFRWTVLEQKTQTPINPVVVAINNETQIKR